MKKIYYIGNYDVDSNKKEKRGYALSARNKIEYICSAINRVGYHVEIVSPAQTSSKKSCSSKTIQINCDTKLKLFNSLGRKGIISKILRQYWMKIQIFTYLFNNTNSETDVIVYHSLAYMNIVKVLKKIKRFNLILEVEEVYGDVIENNRIVNKEYEYFKIADAYIFPTELLDDKINIKRKKTAIVYGSYAVEKYPENNQLLFSQKAKNEIIHVLYAGTLDSRKGGAVAAASVAEYLSSNYHIHILGFGSENDKDNIKKYIAEVQKKSSAKVSYDGVLSGKEYINFIQHCQVGLSTQNPEGAFNDTSFPSKVLSYLSNGLRVVSIRIKVLEMAEIGDMLFYYDKQTPQDIAEAIEKIDFNDKYDSRNRIKELDIKFVKDIGELLR